MISLLATVFTLTMFLSNVPTLYFFTRMNSVQNYQATPFLSLLLNCALWSKYAILLEDSTLLLVNLVGLLVGIASLYTYFKYSDKSAEIVNYCIGFLYAVFGYLYIFNPLSATTQLGFIASGSSILLFGAPLAGMAQVLRTRTVAGIISPIMSSVAFGASFTWSIYGFMIKDAFVIVPNLIGCALTIVQIAMCFVFRRDMNGSLPMSKIRLDPSSKD
ncbi:sugar efflux transporter for intercellular exchange-domain-containing protein [Gorgonomyces haynaldii]|nr:sugar efflux transporter for intercellular exchange-domain-containing protein [Gorgonomyces haynaldii]